MKTKIYKSTPYKNRSHGKETQAEVLLPQGKLTYASHLCFLLLISSLLAAGGVKAGPFYQRVENDLNSYARLQAWPSFDYDISLWIPGKQEELPACNHGLELQAANPNKAPIARVPYVIQCAKPNWQIRAYAKVKVWLKIWHAKTDIAANKPLTPQLLVAKKVEISRLTRGFVTHLDQLVNQYSKRRIRAGKVISPQLLRQPFLINRGDEVIIRASTQTFVATMKGKALQNGKRGDRINIENLSSGKRIQAKVTDEGVVETLF